MADTSRDSIDRWQYVNDLIQENPDKAWAVVVELSRIASPMEIGRVGAGPLETFLVMHELFGRQAAELAKESDRFKAMLSSVTTRGMRPEIREAIRSAVEE